MQYTFTGKDGLAKLQFIQGEQGLAQFFADQRKAHSFHAITFNTGHRQTVLIDNVKYDFESGSVLPLMMNQTVVFENPETITAWRFNREFYCIVNHDAEVGCVGFLFFGPAPVMFLHLDQDNFDKMHRLIALFEEEFASDEDIKGEMLRMLLARLIIKLTRIGKKQYVGKEVIDDRFNLIRQYNLLVEMHYKKERQVQFYAAQLNKSPKTIANVFALYFNKTPLQVIHERIVTEAKRLFYYTDKSVKEIADELGFEDAAHFSKFFKNLTSVNPSELKRQRLTF
jgi:AraC family transcriptional regulator, transcriptional activator of pobA